MAKATTCSANLQQIGQGIQLYLSKNDGSFHDYRNWGRWIDPANPAKQISPHDTRAYWGVAYAVAAGITKESFNCPSARDVLYEAGGNYDGPFSAGNIYQCYGLNAYLNETDGNFSDAQRTAVFGGAGNYIALFERRQTGKPWTGRNIATIKHPSQVIFAQDSYEHNIDGNGDTFNSWTQWANPDKSGEFLRHFDAANVVFADGHVERMKRVALSDVRYYTGMW